MHSTMSSIFSIEQFESIDDLCWQTKCIDAKLFDNSSILKTIADELQLFLGVSTCLLFADNEIVSIYCTNRHRRPTIDDLLIVMRGVRCRPLKSHNDQPKQHSDYIWLKTDDDDSVRVLHNIYR